MPEYYSTNSILSNRFSLTPQLVKPIDTVFTIVFTN